MIWLRRFFVLVPIAAFLAAALLLSCGGGGGGGGTQTGSGLPFSIMSLSICLGPAATRTPTPGPKPTRTPTPKPTKFTSPTPKPTRTPTATPTPKFTPQCIPAGFRAVPTPGIVPGNNTVDFNVQQTIQQNTHTKKYYLDVTSNGSLFWNISPAGILDPPQPSPFPPGQFVAVAQGCACITAQIANVVSCPVVVAVGGVATPCPPCQTDGQVCYGPTPTPTPTRTPRPRHT
jgi:hypothetical protein